MRELLILVIHLAGTLAKLLRPGGARVVAAESLLLKHQLLISNRSRRGAPNLSALDRVVLGLTTLFVSPRRIPHLGALIKPATLLRFQLRQLARQNIPTRVAAKKLGRTLAAVAQKASFEGISFRPKNQRPYGTRKK